MLNYLFLWFFIIFKEIHSLRLVEVIVPSPVANDSPVTLECRYDLEGDQIYAVKWYKDGMEFYRCYGNDGKNVVFPVRGVFVEISSSTCSTVSLDPVLVESSGKYECQLCGEAPYFQTFSAHSYMDVVVLPQGGPIIVGGKTRYRVGEMVDLNCTVTRSNPEAKLSWFINDMLAPAHFNNGPYSWASNDGTKSTLLGLQFEVRPQHFKNGELKLKCVASISDYYVQSDERRVHEGLLFDDSLSTTKNSFLDESTAVATMTSLANHVEYQYKIIYLLLYSISNIFNYTPSQLINF